MECVLIKTYCEYKCGNCIGVLVSILYTHSVVGGVVNCTGVIYGARIHRTVALRLCLLMYIIVKYIGRWLYVDITTKVKFGGTIRLRLYIIAESIGVRNICM